MKSPLLSMIFQFPPLSDDTSKTDFRGMSYARLSIDTIDDQLAHHNKICNEVNLAYIWANFTNHQFYLLFLAVSFENIHSNLKCFASNSSYISHNFVSR